MGFRRRRTRRVHRREEKIARASRIREAGKKKGGDGSAEFNFALRVSAAKGELATAGGPPINRIRTAGKTASAFVEVRAACV